MAINNIKITTHDIFIEKDNKDKGGNLTIGTTTNATSNLIVHGNISGDKATVGSSGLTVDGATGTKTLDVSGSTATNSLIVTTDTTNNGNLTVGGTTNTNTLKVNGSTTTQSLTVSGATNTNTLSVTESVTTKTLNVTGTTTTNTLIVNANIGASGATIGTAGLNVNGTTTMNTLNVTGNTTNNGNLTVGTTANQRVVTIYGTANTNTLNASGNVTVGLNDNSSSKLTIYGSADIRGTNGNLTVSQNITANSLTVNTNTINKGNVTVGTTNANKELTVHGTISTNTLNVNTTTTTNILNVSTINVTGTKKTLTLSVDENSRLNISGNVNINGSITSTTNISMSNINATGDLTVNGTTNTNILNVNAINVAENGSLIIGNNGSLTIGGNSVIHSGNIGTQSVSRADTAGSADSVAWENVEDHPGIATPSAAGLVKSSTTGTTSDRDYNVEVNSDGTMKVNVPWTDTTYSEGTGLTLSNGKFSVNTGFSTNGTNYQVTTDDSGNLYVAVPWTNVATTSSNGLMSSTDKSKLDGIAENANNYSLPVATSEALGGIKVGYSSSGKKYAVALDSENKAYVSVPWTDTTYTNGTGLSLSGGEFSVNIQDNLTSDSSTDVLSAKQGKELKSQIDTKADTSYVESNYVNISTNQTISGTKTFNNAVKGVDGFVIEGTRYGTTQTTTYNNGQISFRRVTNGHLESSCTYTLPDKPGTFAMTDDLKSYLSKSGGTMTGILDLGAQNACIQFNTEDYLVTNMECGMVSLSIKGASGSEASASVTFNNGEKGDGTWYVVATAEGPSSQYSSVGVYGISNSGFTIYARNNSAAPVDPRTLTLRYVAVKYF